MEIIPLIINAVVGFVLSTVPRLAAFRLIAWLLIPSCIAVSILGLQKFTFEGEDSSRVWLLFAIHLLVGLVAFGFGAIFGYFAKLAFIRKKEY